MRWRVNGGGSYTRLIDADYIHVNQWRDQQFIRDGSVVFTISGSVYVPIDEIPTMRLRSGPRDGQVASTTWDTPFLVYFLQTVPLDLDGTPICPVRPSEVAGIVDVYEHSVDCPCGGPYLGWRRYKHVEHEYMWCRQPETYVTVHGGSEAELEP